MRDFTSSLYLGLQHPTDTLRHWEALSIGKPAALENPEGADKVAQALAQVTGCARGTLLASTLHGFWDLFSMLSSADMAIYMDAGVYPVVRWGIERAKAHGLKVQCIRHYDAESLRLQLRRDAHRGFTPVVVVDGFCPVCGKSAPIKSYLDTVRAYGGYVIMDDTQAFGILGKQNGTGFPYGTGGGGTLRWWGSHGDDVIVLNSLAKGFGVPVAILAASKTFVDHFKHKSATRVHCSPPSVAVVHAVEHALNINLRYGDNLRYRLANRVRRFRSRLAELGYAVKGGLFPVQTLQPGRDLPNYDAVLLHEQLMKEGVKTVLHRARKGRPTRISFIITSRHTEADIDYAIQVLDFATQSCSLINGR